MDACAPISKRGWEGAEVQGARLTSIDWLANAAVDALAKTAAASSREHQLTRDALNKSAERARLWRQRLSRATFAAQNHKTTRTDEEGKTLTVVKRDRDSKPAGNLGTSSPAVEATARTEVHAL